MTGVTVKSRTFTTFSIEKLTCSINIMYVTEDIFPAIFCFCVNISTFTYWTCKNSVVSLLKSVSPTFGTCQVVYLQMSCGMQDLPSGSSVCACLKYTARADSDSSSSHRFSAVCCLEKGPHWM